jgi:O-antigen/teichoic acid export membrane protein
MSRTARLVDGVGLGYVHLVLVTIVGLWLTPFLLTRIGQHDLGLWLVATQILAYLGLLDVGVVALLPRETAYATGRAGGGGQGAEVVALVGRVRRIVRWQLPMVGAAAFGCWILLPSEWVELRRPLVLVLATYIAIFPVRLYQALLQGLQDLRFLGIVQLCSWAASTALTIALVLAGWGLGALVLGWVVLQVLTVLAAVLRTRSRHPAVWHAGTAVAEWPVLRPYLRQSLWVSAAQLAQVLLTGTDMLIVGSLLGPLAVVPYSCTAKLVAVLANQPQLLMQTAAPALSELRAAGERERLRVVSAALGRAMLMATGAIACGVIVINRPFVSWWVGPGQYGGRALTLALVVAMVARHWNTTLVYSLFCFGHERRLSLTTLADGAVTIAASVLLVEALGPVGAALGSIAGATMVSIPLNHLALGRELEASPWHFARAQAPLLVRLALVGAVAVAAASHVPATLAGLLGGGAAIAAVYALVMAPLLFKPPLGEFVARALGQRLARPRPADVRAV